MIELSLALFPAIFLCTLAHELGHAFAALRAGTAPVVVLVGSPLCVVRRGRLTLGLGLGTHGGVCYFVAPPSARARAAIAAAGPAASLLTGLTGVAVFVLAGASWIGAFGALVGAVGIAHAVLCGIPRRHAKGMYGAGGNDGHSVLTSLGRRASPERPATPAGPPSVAPPSPPSATPPAAATRPQPRTGRWAFVVLAIVFVFALLVKPLMVLVVIALFAIAGLETREADHAERVARMLPPER